MVGLGHVGLPTGALLAIAQKRVLGVDTSESRIAALNAGRCPIPEAGLQQLLDRAHEEGEFHVSDAAAPARVYLVCVPTPVLESRECDLSHVLNAIRAIVKVAPRGAVIVLESTVPPGTTTGIVRPLIEALGRSVGEDLGLAFCPERVLPGNTIHEIVHNDRVIGGIDERSTSAAIELYAAICEGNCWPAEPTVAEAAKLFENTFRDVNIALANELAAISSRLGIDARAAIQLANHHPRVNIHDPGIGVGGHCIPVDPWFLHEVAPGEAQLIRASRIHNDARPREVAAAIMGALPVGGRVALLGLAYKPDSGDLRESPAIEVARELIAAGVATVAWDPYVPPGCIGGRVVKDLPDAVASADVVAVLVAHAELLARESEIAGSNSRALTIDFTGRLAAADLYPLGRTRA